MSRIIICNITSTLLFIASSCLLYDKSFIITSSDLKSEIGTYIILEKNGSHLILENFYHDDPYIANEIHNFSDTFSQKTKKIFIDHLNQKLAYRLVSNNWILVDLATGRILHKNRKQLSVKNPQSFIVNGKLHKLKYLKNELEFIEPILRNHFDIWNDNLNGEIEIHPTLQEEKHLSRFGMLSFKLNGIKQNYYFVNTTEYAGYVNEDLITHKDLFFKTPVVNSIISSRYDEKRKHPVTAEVKPHYGTDYAGLQNSPILSIGNGEISKIGKEGNNGLNIRIQHNRYYETQYLHLNSFRSNLKLGDFVNKGQVIGYMGSTGLATGTHLCFRFRYLGKQIDHTAHKRKHYTYLKGDLKAEIQGKINHYKSEMLNFEKPSVQY